MFIVGFICGILITVIAAIAAQQLLARSAEELRPHLPDYGYVKQQMVERWGEDSTGKSQP